MIIIYIAWSFRQVPKPANSWAFGTTAVIALLHDLLITLINDINLISDVQKNMSSIAKNHSWLSRAKQVVEDLS